MKLKNRILLLVDHIVVVSVFSYYNKYEKFFSPIFLTISLLLLIYTFYKSEIFWEGSKRNYYLTYYIIYSIFFFSLSSHFFISKKIKEYLIIIAVSCILSLYLFEGYLTYKVQLSQIAREKAYKKITGNKWDKRSSFEIYKELKKVDKKVGVSVLPINFMSKNYPLLPLSGISNTKIIFCNENGYYANYRSDRYGFNNPDDQWDKNEIEYLLVGDSFTHGSCVNRPNDIGSVLRTLTSKPVLNLGLGGNGPLIEYATLREYLNVNVKKVIWIYYGNDIENLVVEKKNNILIKYLDDLNFTQNLKLKQNEIDNLAIEMINELQLQMKEESKQKQISIKRFY